jgi:hypothetical protein
MVKILNLIKLFSEFQNKRSACDYHKDLNNIKLNTLLESDMVRAHKELLKSIDQVVEESLKRINAKK